MPADRTPLEEYEWALQQAKIALGDSFRHGEVRKWIIYAGEQLEIAGFPRDKISTKLRNDLPHMCVDYISQICKERRWTDSRFAPEVENSQPENSSTLVPDILAFEDLNKSPHARENQPYITHLQKKISFLQEVQEKLKERPFMSLVDGKQYEEYTFLADSAERLAREAWDARQTIPVETQFFLTQIVSISTIKHGASEYVSKVKELFGLTSKQVTKTLKGVIRDVHCLYEPTSKMEALMDGFYGKPCEKCGSWRVRWENGTCRCYRCSCEYRVSAEKLLLAREQPDWSN
jgi:hypothetical protein